MFGSHRHPSSAPWSTYDLGVEKESNVLSVVEICAGAGGQALGLELGGFEHRLAVELDATAAATLKSNRPHWEVRVGDVASSETWDPGDYADGLDLLAGGVPCPPFSIAGHQLGSADERDLFAWAVELAGTMQPRALLLENVRGLSMPRFAGYRQHVADRLRELGYWSEWKLVHARDFGVPQLRPRFILVALRETDAKYFHWPEPTASVETVGSALYDLMAVEGWSGAEVWRTKANDIAPTIVGGSKRHGGADLGPTRAKAAWARLGVDAKGVADAPPSADAPFTLVPRLTTEMVARIQGWGPEPELNWHFTGRKTSRYRQIGNAFPPPVARALGRSIGNALNQVGEPRTTVVTEATTHDPVLLALRSAEHPLTLAEIMRATGQIDSPTKTHGRLRSLMHDFDIIEGARGDELTFTLGDFRAFIGQSDHDRHLAFEAARSRVS